LIQKIISGGQTGVDQAALDVAIAFGLDAGGWCPPGRVCENGQIPLHYPLTETPHERSNKALNIPRSQRTEWNVRDADATLILQPLNNKNDKGTDWTIKCAIDYERPYLIVNPFEKNAADDIYNWLYSLKAGILNVAGPGEITFPGIGEQTKQLLYKVFSF
jgi:hypothetical protein